MLALKQLYRGFRNPETIKILADNIQQEALNLKGQLNIMEVCGGHTHSIMKYGLDQLLPDNIDFVHGPGCPVCIMPKERIDSAATLSSLPDVILVTLGDMIRVPGSNGSLADYRSKGCDVRPVYDPLDALKIAKENPDKTVVFFAIGFETSTPMTAVLIELAEAQHVDNLLFHINHVLVPPAIDTVMADENSNIHAFIGPAHVSVISGAKVYRPAVENYGIPVVVSGFEPVDVMESILLVVKQTLANVAKVEIQYSRLVTEDGNRNAQSKIDKYLTVRPSFRWRGLGSIPNSSLMLRDEYRHRDAEYKYANCLSVKEIGDHKACRCGDILRGISKPKDCKVFGRGCTPYNPLGSCMVSSEGACNAYYRYNGV